MTDYADLVKRLRETLLRERNEALKWSKSYEREAEILTKDFVRVCAERDAAIARAQNAEGAYEVACRELAALLSQRDALHALLRESAGAITALLQTPEIADCAPRDKDEDTHVAERIARDCQKKIEEMVG